MTRPRASVVILSFEQVDFLETAVHSALAQTYPDLEIVITDDGSTDGTAQLATRLAAAHPERVRALCSPTNTGIAGNVNRGIAASRGDYVALLGGDDLMLPERIATQVACLDAAPRVTLCSHDVEVFDSDTDRTLHRFSDRNPMRSGGIELMLDSNWLYAPIARYLPSGHMYRRSALPPGGFDERLAYRNDWLHDAQVIARGRLAYLPRVLGRYRRHAGNVTGCAEIRERGLEEALMALAILESRHPDLAPRVRRKRRALMFRAWSALPAGSEERERVGRWLRQDVDFAERLYMQGLARLLASRGALRAWRRLSRPRRSNADAPRTGTGPTPTARR